MDSADRERTVAVGMMSMNAECRIESDGMIFRFCVTDKGTNDVGYYWTDASIHVENWCFKYKTSHSCFEFRNWSV